MPGRVVIAGGGVAAQRCAFALRALGHDGPIEMIAAEEQAPYDRTLVSKDMLRDPHFGPPVELRPREDYEESSVSLRLGTRVTGLDAAQRRVMVDDGAPVPYDHLVIATGGRAVVPSRLAAEGVLTVRQAADLPELDDALKRSMHLVVVGGGFIGGEVAAAAVARLCPVTLVEAASGPLAPLFGDDVGRRMTALHEQHGVEVIAGTGVTAIDRGRGGFNVELSDARRLRADSVVVGVGMTPDVEWLCDSPVELNRGIVTDSFCRTSVPRILAAGDCARWLHPRYGVHMRVEHWDTAGRHGDAAAATIMGSERPFAPVPFFWSDQHGSKLQWVGHAPVWDSVDLEDDTEPGFIARYRVGDELVGVLAVDRPRALARARRELSVDNREVASR